MVPPPTAGGHPDQQAADRAALAEPIRQSPIAVVFMALKFVRNLGVVQIGVAVVFIASGRAPVALLLAGAAAAVLGLVIAVLQWWRFTFVVQADELLVSKGVLAQERLTIPMDRVQSVSVEQKFLHRLVGLVSAAVDTAGSSTAEFEIDAIDRGRAEALQRLVAGQRRTATSPHPVGPVGVGQAATDLPQEEELVSRSLSDLIKIGISGWPWAGLVALAPILALGENLFDFIPLDVIDGDELIDDLPSEFGPSLVGVLIAVVIGVLLVVTLLGALLQIGREVVSHWDLKLIKTETGFRRTAGLFSKTSKASTATRIQSLQIDRTPMEKFLGIAKLTLPTIGEGDLVVPGTSESEIDRVRRIVFEGGSEPPVLDRKISYLSIFLAVRNRAFVAVPLSILLYFTIGWWSALILVSIPLEWLIARRRWRLRRWSLTPVRISEYYELVNQHSAEVDLIKAQTVTVSQSFFERRRGLATIKIDMAEGYLSVPLIGHAEANAVRDRALFAAESDGRAWM